MKTAFQYLHAGCPHTQDRRRANCPTCQVEIVYEVRAEQHTATLEECARIADAHARGDDEGSETACAIADEIRARKS